MPFLWKKKSWFLTPFFLILEYQSSVLFEFGNKSDNKNTQVLQKTFILSTEADELVYRTSSTCIFSNKRRQICQAVTYIQSSSTSLHLKHGEKLPDTELLLVSQLLLAGDEKHVGAGGEPAVQCKNET